MGSTAAAPRGLHPDRAQGLVRLSGRESLRQHWPEYLMEAAALGLFMISAGVITVLIAHPQPWLRAHLTNPVWSRLIIGVAMGGTAMALIYSPWGRRSGAHMNPAVTLAFLRLGRIPPWDALYYCLFQLLGGLAGVLVCAAVIGAPFTTSPVTYVVTVPGPHGALPALLLEGVIAMLMMGMIQALAPHARLARYTGLCAGILICAFVTVESPWSGFGMNPARTLASALPSGVMTALWVYLIAPPVGMLAVVEVIRRQPWHAVHCCKLHHARQDWCIFCGHAWRDRLDALDGHAPGEDAMPRSQSGE